MSIELDHLLVPTRDRVASARQLAELLGVPWSANGVGPFSPVYVSDGLTLDFDEAAGSYPVQHYCFRVTQAAFEAILTRIRLAGLPYRSLPHGADDYSVNTAHGGSMVYWNSPGGHIWEMLTVSYERQVQ